METRREFLQKMGLAGAALVASKAGFPSIAADPMPKRRFGKTGWDASLLAFGTAELPTGDMALCEKMLSLALDEGVNYFDTAPSYRGTEAEKAIGRVAKRRKEFFLATKTLERKKAGAAREIEESLRRLGTDQIDTLQIHSVNDIRDLDTVLAAGGAIEALEEAKKAGKIRFIGITGHTRPAVILAALKRYKFDSVLVPLSAADFHVNDFATEVVPRAKELGIGIAGMKSLKGWQGGSRPVPAQKMLHYSMTLPVSTLTCGMTSEAQVRENLAAARAFKPLTETQMAELRQVAKEWSSVTNLWWKRT